MQCVVRRAAERERERHRCPRAHTKLYSLNISAAGNFHKAVNELRDKARRAFYTIKRNIQFDIPIRIWLTILESPTKNLQNGEKHQIETLHAEFCKKYPPCTT